VTDNQIFEPDGRAIPYAAEGSGPAIVVLPGRGLSVGYLGSLAHSVSQEDFRVVRVGSRRPPVDGDAVVSMRDLAQDVIDVMDHLGVTDAWVGGHAFGGSVARALSLVHPDRVNGVLLLGVEAMAGEFATLAPGIPVLVVQGTEDQITPPQNGEDLRAGAPDQVSVVRIEDGGHMFPATHVGATSWAIEDYLDWD
jgi:pimeloyl-ACP methyl ester carboxylesterase